MRCVVMCGGRGERLRPLTDTCPKPLLPVAGRPVLDRLLEKLAEAGLTDVTLAVGYLGQQIMDYCDNGARWGLKVDYVIQDQPMGTAGALSLLSDKSRHVLVVNGDKIVERASDIALLTEHHYAVATVPIQLPYGVMEWFEDSWGFEEKPTVHACAGLYVIPPGYLERVTGFLDMPALLTGYVTNAPFEGYVLDIGTPATYEAACQRLAATAAHPR